LLIPSTYLSKIELIKQNEHFNIKIENQKIHSIKIENELQRILSSIPDNIENLLLIGSGVGEIIEVIQKFKKDIKLFINEPIKNLEYIHHFLLNKKFHYIHQYNELKHLRSLYILVYPSYKRILPELIDSILAYLENDINKKTFYKFLYFWIVNYVKNLNEDSIKFIHTLNINKNKILFCGSGITLISDLKKYKLSDYYIIASDSSVIPLLKNNIKINLVISIDPHIGTLYHFYEYKNRIENIPLLTWLGSRNELKYIFKNRYFFLTSFPLDSYIYKSSHQILYLNPPAKDVLEYVKILSQIYQKSLFLAGCGIKKSLKFYYTKNTGYDYYAQLKNQRTFTLENYHYNLYKNQSYKRTDFSLKNKELIENIDNNISKDIIYKEIETKWIKEIFYRYSNEIIKNYPFFKLFYYIL
jgi:hypothetical protein